MRVIPVDVYPLKEQYQHDSLAEAIAGAMHYPLQPKARSDTTRLQGAALIDACWTDTDFVLRFSDGKFLHIYIDGEELNWNLVDTAPALDESIIERVGAAAVLCRWR